MISQIFQNEVSAQLSILNSLFKIKPGLKPKLPLINLLFKSNSKLVIHKSVT